MNHEPDLRVSRAAVVGLDDEALSWAVIEPVWPDAGVKDELAHVGKATVGQRAFYVTTLFAREVSRHESRAFNRNILAEAN